jgi:hypothetical protein
LGCLDLLDYIVKPGITQFEELLSGKALLFNRHIPYSAAFILLFPQIVRHPSPGFSVL